MKAFEFKKSYFTYTIWNYFLWKITLYRLLFFDDSSFNCICLLSYFLYFCSHKKSRKTRKDKENTYLLELRQGTQDLSVKWRKLPQSTKQYTQNQFLYGSSNKSDLPVDVTGPARCQCSPVVLMERAGRGTEVVCMYQGGFHIDMKFCCINKSFSLLHKNHCKKLVRLTGDLVGFKNHIQL